MVMQARKLQLRNDMGLYHTVRLPVPITCFNLIEKSTINTQNSILFNVYFFFIFFPSSQKLNDSLKFF